MQKIWITWTLCCALLAAPRLDAGAGDTGLPQPFYTRQPSFSIPFIPPTAAAGEQEIVEVRLFLSSDYGGTWTLADRVEAKKAGFSFRAPHDGEYWFSIRGVDRQGHLKPDKPNSPELRVIVDTLPPRLDLKAVRTAEGQIRLNWVAVDPILKADTLTIEYQVAGDTAWRNVLQSNLKVADQPWPRDDPARSTAQGTVAWPLAETGTVTVRATIRDRAGNVATAQATVEENRPAMEGPSLEAPPRSAPASLPPGRAMPAEERHDRTTRRETPRPPPANSPAQPGVEAALASTPGSANWPADRLTGRPLGDEHSPAPTDSAQRGAVNSPGRSIFAQSAAPQAAGPVESRINPAVADRVVAPSTAAEAARGLPPGEHPYMVNSRNFALEYEVESVGPSGIAKVEIWGTNDGGRIWKSFGIKPREPGPVKVSVPDEGLYGFRITVQDGNGLGNRPPKSGDLPELWVRVDLTKPAAKLTAIDLGTGEHAGELLIRWEASDAMLAARPVTLLFSERPNGDWSTIAAGLDNTGAYNWRFDNRVPDNIFVRLDVRDEAGNVGQFQTAQPISLAPNRPEGHLRSVRPTDDSASRSTRQYWR